MRPSTIGVSLLCLLLSAGSCRDADEVVEEDWNFLPRRWQLSNESSQSFTVIWRYRCGSVHTEVRPGSVCLTEIYLGYVVSSNEGRLSWGEDCPDVSLEIGGCTIPVVVTQPVAEDRMRTPSYSSPWMCQNAETSSDAHQTVISWHITDAALSEMATEAEARCCEETPPQSTNK